MLYLTWLGVAFGLRSITQRRRTGDAGWRSLGGRPGSIQWWTPVIVGIGAVAAGLAAPIADLIGLSPIGALDRPWLRTIGLALAALATAASIAAQHAMGTAWRIGVDETEHTTLVTNGAFRVVRNPFFSAVIGFATGLALAVPNIIALAGLATVIIGVQLQVRSVEEPHLLRVHEDNYRCYTSHVGRFLPYLGRTSRSRCGSGVPCPESCRQDRAKHPRSPQTC